MAPFTGRALLSRDGWYYWLLVKDCSLDTFHGCYCSKIVRATLENQQENDDMTLRT